MSDPLALAGRCEALDEKLRRIVGHRQLSPSGQATAIALIVTLDLNLFAECAAALRRGCVK